jgi:hypothetical protein
MLLEGRKSSWSEHCSPGPPASVHPTSLCAYHGSTSTEVGRPVEAASPYADCQGATNDMAIQLSGHATQEHFARSRR